MTTCHQFDDRWVGWIPRNFKISILKPILWLLRQNHKHNHKDEFSDLYKFAPYDTSITDEVFPPLAIWYMRFTYILKMIISMSAIYAKKILFTREFVGIQKFILVIIFVILAKKWKFWKFSEFGLAISQWIPVRIWVISEFSRAFISIHFDSIKKFIFQLQSRSMSELRHWFQQ